MRISELAKKADVSVRTIRYYIEEGLLPQPERKGPQTEYGPEYVVRLKLIQALKKAFLPLSEIRDRINQLSQEEIWSLLREAVETDELEVRVLSSPVRQPTLNLDAPMQLRELDSPAFFAAMSTGPDLVRREPKASQETENPAKEYIERLLGDRVDKPQEETSLGPTSSGQWERYELADGLEFHVRGPLDRKREMTLRRILQNLQQELRRW